MVSDISAHFQPICFHCGESENLYDGPDLAQYKLEYSIVRPICIGCHVKGLQPAVRNALKVGKKRKR